MARLPPQGTSQVLLRQAPPSLGGGSDACRGGTLEGPAREACRRATILTHLQGPNQGPTTKDTTPANAPESAQDSLARALMLILDQVRTLSDTAFKVLAVITGLFALQPGRSGRISARDLAEKANISRRSVQYGLDDLSHNGLISITGGGGPKAPTITLTYLGIARFTGANFAPLDEEIHRWGAQILRQYGATGANFAPVDTLFPQERGANSTPVNQHTGANFAPVEDGHADGPPASARVDSRSTSISILDRVFNAKPRDFDPGELREAARWVHGYQCNDKYGGDRDRNRNPPDEKITAQIIAATGSLSKVIWLINHLSAGREEPGHQYSWYVTMALNRIHGFKAEEVKEARAQLKLARKPSPPAIAGEQLPLSEAATATALDADPEFRNQLLSEIAEQRRKGARG
jgi:hypothetical protein